MKNPENTKRINFLKALKGRAHLHQPATAQAFVPVLETMIANLEDEGNEEKAAKEYAELVAGARAGDIGMSAEVASIRRIRVSNFLMAKSNAMTFFDMQVLADNDQPFITNTSRQEIDVNYIGQDGRARKMQAIKYQQDVQVPLYLISSAEFEYPLRDLIRGGLADETKNLVDVAYDLDRKIDAKTFPYITGRIGAFTLTGSKAARTYVPHSTINSANLPTTNLLVSASSGAGTRFNQDCLNAIMDYTGAFADVFPDGPIAPQVIYIPSKDSQGWLRSISLSNTSVTPGPASTGAGNNSFVESIIQTGQPYQYAGRTWLFVPDATLDPTAGLAYVKTTKPVGTFFTKPNWDEMFVEEGINARRQNKGNMSMQKAVGWGLPSTQAVNVMAVRYKTAGT
jgi:hypothetical protein